MKFLYLLGNQDDSKLSLLCSNIGSMNLNHSTPLKAENQGTRFAVGFDYGTAHGFRKIDKPVFGAPAVFTNENLFGAYDLKPFDGKNKFENGHEIKEIEESKGINDVKAEGEIKEDKDIKAAEEDKN